MERFSFAEVIFDSVSHGCFHADIQPLRRQPEIPTPSNVIFFPRTSTWAIPEGRQRYLCDPGLVSFWSRGQVCLREPAASPAVDGEWFAFAPSVAVQLVADADPGALWSSRWLFRRQSATVGAELFGRQRRLAAAIQSGRCERDQAAEAIVCLGAECLRLGAVGAATSPSTSSSTERRDRELVETIRLQIASDPAARPGLVELARRAGVGMVTLCTSFRRVAGSSIHAYRLDLRLKLALERLERSTEELSRIALDLGFDSHSHFSRHFRARFGVAPSRVRADLRALGRLRLKERDSGGARRR